MTIIYLTDELRRHLLTHGYFSSSASSIPVAPTLVLRASVKRFVSLQFLKLRESVGLLGRWISPSQGRYLTKTE
jgi:hypothetical protein